MRRYIYSFGKVSYSLLLVLWAVSVGFGTEHPPKDRPTASKSTSPAAAAKPAAVAPGSMAELDMALAQLNQGLSAEAATTAPADAMLNLPAQVSAQIADQRDKARQLFGYLDQNPDRVREQLTPEDLVVLPVGLSTKLGDNSRITLGILSAEFGPTCTRSALTSE